MWKTLGQSPVANPQTCPSFTKTDKFDKVKHLTHYSWRNESSQMPFKHRLLQDLASISASAPFEFPAPALLEEWLPQALTEWHPTLNRDIDHIAPIKTGASDQPQQQKYRAKMLGTLLEFWSHGTSCPSSPYEAAFSKRNTRLEMTFIMFSIHLCHYVLQICSKTISTMTRGEILLE